MKINRKIFSEAMSKQSAKKGKSDKDKAPINEATTNNSAEQTAENAQSSNETEVMEPGNDTEKMSEPCPEISELEKLQLELAQMKDKYIRLSAEFDNYRKRTLKEKMDLMKSAGEDIFLNILPVVDNLDRAMKAIETATEIAPVKEGIVLINSNFRDFLVKRNVKEIPGVGEAFNTDLHEAITKIPAPTPELKGKVVDIIEKGYTLGDKVIRFAKVVIGD